MSEVVALLGVPSGKCGYLTLRKINYIKACFFQIFSMERTSFLYLAKHQRP
mgnify:CR=1 FL=1